MIRADPAVDYAPLLERCFFFAPEFCNLIIAMAGGGEASATSLPAFVIDDPGRIGDLMGAIHGVRYTGFIGAVYRRFPFPDSPSGFRQNPEGGQTRAVMAELMAGYARTLALRVAVSSEPAEVTLGDYRFDRAGFHALLEYVWRGGYPRWRGGVRPACVLEMASAARASSGVLFEGLSFSG